MNTFGDNGGAGAADRRRHFISQIRQPGLLINGKERPAATGRSFTDRCPATGMVIAELAQAGKQDVDEAVASARAAFLDWSGMDGAERGRLLNRLADAIEAERDRISLLESIDNGRPLRETASQAAIVAKWFRYYAGITDKLEGATVPVSGPYLNYTRRLPVGVCAAITPWNHPMLIATKKIAPAIACGNVVVVKPSELASLSVIELGRIALEAGIPPGVINILTGGREAGALLAEHPGVDRIDVTGSTPTGMAVARAAAGTLKRLGMELGGKSANLIFDGTDLDRLARGAVFSAFIAQGQSCVAGSRLLVQTDIVEPLTERITAAVESIRLGDPIEQRTQMGPVITVQAATRIRAMIDSAEAQGATVLSGGDRRPALSSGLNPEGFVTPTVLAVPDPSAVIAREEIFGPVMTITPFRDEAEAVEITNSVPFGLGAAVWSADVSRAHRVASRLRSGVVWINDYHRIDPASPWGGFKLSGYGRENGYAAIEEYTAPQSVWVPLEEDPIDWYDDGGGSRLN